MKAEPPGAKVWRLFEPLIRKYETLYMRAEVEWQDQICKHINPRLDFPFVGQLCPEDRTGFWVDKLRLFSKFGVLHSVFLPLVERVCDEMTLTKEPTVQDEFLYIVLLFLEDHTSSARWLLHRLRMAFSPTLFSGSHLTEQNWCVSVPVRRARIPLGFLASPRSDVRQINDA